MAGADLYSNAIANRANAKNAKLELETYDELEPYRILENTVNSAQNAFSLVSTYQSAFKSDATQKKIEAQSAEMRSNGIEVPRSQSYVGMSLEQKMASQQSQLENLQKMQDTADIAQGKLDNDKFNTNLTAMIKSAVSDQRISVNGENGEVTLPQDIQDLVKKRAEEIESSPYSYSTKTALASQLYGYVEDGKRSALTGAFAKKSSAGYEALNTIAVNAVQSQVGAWLNTNHMPVTDSSGKVLGYQMGYVDPDISKFDYDPLKDGTQSIEAYVQSLVADGGLSAENAFRVKLNMEQKAKDLVIDTYLANAVDYGRVSDFVDWLESSGMYSRQEKTEYRQKAFSKENELVNTAKAQGGNRFTYMEQNYKGVDQYGNGIPYSTADMYDEAAKDLRNINNPKARASYIEAFQSKQIDKVNLKVTGLCGQVDALATVEDVQAMYGSFGETESLGGDGRLATSAGENYDLVYGLSREQVAKCLQPLKAKLDEKRKAREEVAEKAASAVFSNRLSNLDEEMGKAWSSGDYGTWKALGLDRAGWQLQSDLKGGMDGEAAQQIYNDNVTHINSQYDWKVGLDQRKADEKAQEEAQRQAEADAKAAVQKTEDDRKKQISDSKALYTTQNEGYSATIDALDDDGAIVTDIQLVDYGEALFGKADSEYLLDLLDAGENQGLIDAAEAKYVQSREAALTKFETFALNHYKEIGDPSRYRNVLESSLTHTYEARLAALKSQFVEGTEEYEAAKERLDTEIASSRNDLLVAAQKFSDSVLQKILADADGNIQPHLATALNSYKSGAITGEQAVDMMNAAIAEGLNLPADYSPIWDTEMTDGWNVADGKDSMAEYIYTIAPEVYNDYNTKFFKAVTAALPSQFQGIYTEETDGIKDVVAVALGYGGYDKDSYNEKGKRVLAAPQETRKDIDNIVKSLYAQSLDLAFNGMVDPQTGKPRVATAEEFERLFTNFDSAKAKAMLDFSRRNGLAQELEGTWVSPFNAKREVGYTAKALELGAEYVPEAEDRYTQKKNAEQILDFLGEYESVLPTQMWLEGDRLNGTMQWRYSDKSVRDMAESLWSLGRDVMAMQVPSLTMGEIKLSPNQSDAPQYAEVDGTIHPYYTFKDPRGNVYRYTMVDDGMKGGSIYRLVKDEHGDYEIDYSMRLGAFAPSTDRPYAGSGGYGGWIPKQVGEQSEKEKKALEQVKAIGEANEQKRLEWEKDRAEHNEIGDELLTMVTDIPEKEKAEKELPAFDASKTSLHLANQNGVPLGRGVKGVAEDIGGANRMQSEADAMLVKGLEGTAAAGANKVKDTVVGGLREDAQLKADTEVALTKGMAAAWRKVADNFVSSIQKGMDAGVASDVEMTRAFHDEVVGGISSIVHEAAKQNLEYDVQKARQEEKAMVDAVLERIPEEYMYRIADALGSEKATIGKGIEKVKEFLREYILKGIGAEV